MIVYSTIYGGHDRPKPPRPHPAVAEWRLYTDDPEIYAPGWRVVVEPVPADHPRMQAKLRKCNPPPDADRSVYLDASIRLRDPCLLEAAYRLLEAGDTWCMFRHPERISVAEEVEVSLTMPKYRDLAVAMRDQLAAYEELMLDWQGLGLWAGGILVRRHTPTVLRAGADWYSQCARWTYQDQVSLPIVLARHGIQPTELAVGGGLWGNAHFTVERHRTEL